MDICMRMYVEESRLIHCSVTQSMKKHMKKCPGGRCWFIGKVLQRGLIVLETANLGFSCATKWVYSAWCGKKGLWPETPGWGEILGNNGQTSLRWQEGSCNLIKLSIAMSRKTALNTTHQHLRQMSFHASIHINHSPHPLFWCFM